MKSRDGELSIGELAGDFGLATHVLRHWESVGLLRPVRRVGDRRRYTPEHRFQVALILQAKLAGLSLEQIREVVEAPDGRSRRARLDAYLAELDARIARLRAARELVAHAVDCPEEDFLECPRMRPILDGSCVQNLSEETAERPRPSRPCPSGGGNRDRHRQQS